MVAGMRYYVILFLNKIIIFNLLFVLFKSTTKDNLMSDDLCL